MVGCQTVVRLVGVLRMNHHHEPEEGRISWRLTLKKRNLFGLVWRSIQRWRQPSDDEFRCATGAAVAPTYLLYADLTPMHYKKQGGGSGNIRMVTRACPARDFAAVPAGRRIRT